MAATDARPVPQKNVAYRVYFPIRDVNGNLVTGAAGLDSERSLDGATFADCTNEATEVATSSGIYYLDLTAAEMNTDCTAINVKTTTTDAKTTSIFLYPEEVGDVRVTVTGHAMVLLGAYPELGISDSGTAQSATATTLVLRAAAVFPNNVPIGSIIGVFGSTQGYWQYRSATAYVGSTDTVTVDTWDVTPSGTISYIVFASAPGALLAWNPAWDAEVQSECQDAITASALATAANLATVDTVVDSILALLDDPRGEPGIGAPAVNPDLATKLDYLYKWMRNKKDNTGAENRFYADNGSTVDQKQTTAESGGTVTVGEMITG